MKVEQLIIEQNEPIPHAVDMLLLGVHVRRGGILIIIKRCLYIWD